MYVIMKEPPLVVLRRQEALPIDIPPIPRRSERRPAAIPISFALEAENFKADNSAITTDISTDGTFVRTSLGLVPGEWVGFVKKGTIPSCLPSRVVWVWEDEDSSWMFARLEFLKARI